MKRIFYFLLLLLLLNCKSCEKENKVIYEDLDFKECGECLNLQTGKVCTVQGTFFNSCLAICKQVKILCQGECPCPTK